MVDALQFWKRKRCVAPDMDGATLDIESVEGNDDDDVATHFELDDEDDNQDDDEMSLSTTRHENETHSARSARSMHDELSSRTEDAGALPSAAKTSAFIAMLDEVATGPRGSSFTHVSGREARAASTKNKPRPFGLTRITPTPIHAAIDSPHGSHAAARTTVGGDTLGRLLFPKSDEKHSISGDMFKLGSIPIPSASAVKTRGRDDVLDRFTETTEPYWEAVPVDLDHDPTSGGAGPPDEAEPLRHLGAAIQEQGKDRGRWPSFHDVFFGIHDELDCEEMTAVDTATWTMLVDTRDANEPAVHDAMFGLLSGQEDIECGDDSCLGQWMLSIITFALSMPLLYQTFRFCLDRIISYEDTGETSADLCAPLFLPVEGYVGVISID